MPVTSDQGVSRPNLIRELGRVLVPGRWEDRLVRLSTPGYSSCMVLRLAIVNSLLPSFWPGNPGYPVKHRTIPRSELSLPLTRTVFLAVPFYRHPVTPPSLTSNPSFRRTPELLELRPELRKMKRVGKLHPTPGVLLPSHPR